MTRKVAINGFGRIGRQVLKLGLANRAIDFVAINDITDTATLAYLLKHDSVHGTFPAEISHDKDHVIVNGKKIRVVAEKNPENLPWREFGVDIAIESTGLFTDREPAAKHLAAGAKKVIISAPAKGEDLTIVLGVNQNAYDPAKHHILSNASCTTNCLAPVTKVIHEKFGIERATMTTIHSYTNDQKILDLPHKDLRRARAAALSMIPTTTGAAKAVSLVLPELKGKIDGLAIRVPTPNVSLVDLVCVVKADATIEEVNAAMKQAAQGPLRGILQYCEEPLVSCDFNGNPHSSIFDSLSTYVIDKRLVKVLSWYDNETGFSQRVVDLMGLIAEKW